MKKQARQIKQKTLEEILERERAHRCEDGAFGITACKEHIRSVLKTKVYGEGMTLEDLLGKYVERANADIFFNSAMVLACYELIEERDGAVQN